MTKRQDDILEAIAANKRLEGGDALELLDKAGAEIERLRNIALDALPYLQQCAASMGSGSGRAKLRSVIGQIILFVPDDLEQRPVKED